MVRRLFCSSPFIAHYQLKHKSSYQGQTNHLIKSSYIMKYSVCKRERISTYSRNKETKDTQTVHLGFSSNEILARMKIQKETSSEMYSSFNSVF